jgi:hypothetical protein
VGPYHSEGLLDAKMQRPAHALGDVAAKGTQAAGQRASGPRLTLLTDRQVSRAASRNSSSSCSEEL